MNLIVPTSVRASLAKFDLSGKERFIADEIGGCAARGSDYTVEDNFLKIIEKDYHEFKRRKTRIWGNWPKFVVERLVSEEELSFLVGDESPFCREFPDGRGTPKERYRFLMEGFFQGDFASRPVRELWQRHLELNFGDPLAAEISLEFALPDLLEEERLKCLAPSGKAKLTERIKAFVKFP